jgi:dTDP-4-dehydrorhamnose reductase
MTKVIIFGMSGTIGTALNQTLSDKGYDVYGTYYQHRPMNVSPDKIIQLPIEKYDWLNKFLSEVKPDYVIMAMRGDFDKQLKLHIKTAEFLQSNGGQMIFCSTANVFDAVTDSPHYEDDLPKADSEYGQYKIECERLLTAILGDKLTIVRIPTILGHETPQINELLQHLKDGKAIKLYTNLHSTRNSDNMLSKQIEYLINQKRTGIFHLATTDVMIHSEFTRTLLSQSGFTDVKFEESKIETFSSVIPDKYDNSLLTRNALPSHLQITHEQLITFLATGLKV